MNVKIPTLILGTLIIAHSKVPVNIIHKSNLIGTIITNTIYGSQLTGTGFILDSGLIATNHHVIASAKNISFVRKNSGKTDTISISNIYSIFDPIDLAILEAPSLKSEAGIQIERKIEAKVGEDVFIIGSPLGLEGTISQGIISSKRKVDVNELLQFTAPISPGSSGSPIFNTNGKLVGVVSSTIQGGQTINFGIQTFELWSLRYESELYNCCHIEAKRKRFLRANKLTIGQASITDHIKYFAKLKDSSQFQFTDKPSKINGGYGTFISMILSSYLPNLNRQLSLLDHIIRFEVDNCYEENSEWCQNAISSGDILVHDVILSLSQFKDLVEVNAENFEYDETLIVRIKNILNYFHKLSSALIDEDTKNLKNNIKELENKHR